MSVDFNSAELNRTVFTASSGQTEFTYDFWTPPGILDSEIRVLQNNVEISAFTVNTSTKLVTLDSGATEDDKIEIYRDLTTKFSVGFGNTTALDGPILTLLLGRVLAYIQDLIFKHERFNVDFSLRVGQNDDWTVLLSSYNSFTIDKVVYETSSGEIDFTISRNGTALTDLEDVTATSTQTSVTPSSTITINRSDNIVITTSGNDDATDLAISIYATKKL